MLKHLKPMSSPNALEGELTSLQERDADLERQIDAGHENLKRITDGRQALLISATDFGDGRLTEIGCDIEQAEARLRDLTDARQLVRDGIARVEAELEAKRDRIVRDAEVARIEKLVASARTAVAELDAGLHKFCTHFASLGSEGQIVANMAAQFRERLRWSAPDVITAMVEYKRGVADGQRAVPSTLVELHLKRAAKARA